MHALLGYGHNAQIDAIAPQHGLQHTRKALRHWALESQHFLQRIPQRLGNHFFLLEGRKRISAGFKKPGRLDDQAVHEHFRKQPLRAQPGLPFAWCVPRQPQCMIGRRGFEKAQRGVPGHFVPEPL